MKLFCNGGNLISYSQLAYLRALYTANIYMWQSLVETITF